MPFGTGPWRHCRARDIQVMKEQAEHKEHCEYLDYFTPGTGGFAKASEKNQFRGKVAYGIFRGSFIAIPGCPELFKEGRQKCIATLDPFVPGPGGYLEAPMKVKIKAAFEYADQHALKILGA